MGGLAVHVAWNGRCSTHNVDHVGTMAATLTTQLAVTAFKPDIVISAGTAGGFKAKASGRGRAAVGFDGCCASGGNAR